MTGPVTVTLYASSSSSDTDFTAKLVDVFPDGTAVNLANGILATRSRESLSHSSPIEPGRIYQYKINVWPTSNLFLTGAQHSPGDFVKRLSTICSQSKYRRRFGTSTKWITAKQIIIHDREHPSAITLPVIPPGASGQGKDAAPQN